MYLQYEMKSKNQKYFKVCRGTGHGVQEMTSKESRPQLPCDHMSLLWLFISSISLDLAGSGMSICVAHARVILSKQVENIMSFTIVTSLWLFLKNSQLLRSTTISRGSDNCYGNLKMEVPASPERNIFVLCSAKAFTFGFKRVSVV